MASAALDGNDRGVSIGRVFSRGFGTIGSNPVATLGIAFLFSALPWLLIAYAGQTLRADSFETLGPATAIAVAIFSLLGMLLLGVVTQGVLVRVTVAFSEGGKASLGESVVAGLRVALPLFVLAVVSAVAMMLGFLLFVVPAVILFIMWSVAAPALVEERLGPIEALGRSRYLTKGARWKIFGLMLVVLVLYWLIVALVSVLTVLLYGSLSEFAASGDELSVGEMVINGIATTITSAISGVMQPSLYVELRDWKDGPRTDALAEIFG